MRHENQYETDELFPQGEKIVRRFLCQEFWVYLYFSAVSAQLVLRKLPKRLGTPACRKRRPGRTCLYAQVDAKRTNRVDDRTCEKGRAHCEHYNASLICFLNLFFGVYLPTAAHLGTDLTRDEDTSTGDGSLTSSFFGLHTHRLYRRLVG